MSISLRGRRPTTIAEINVTPMADVVIVLLIIFMVVGPMIPQAPVALPQAANSHAYPQDLRLLVALKADGTFLLGGRPVEGMEALAAAVRTRLDSLKGDPVLYLQADRSLTFAQVQRVMDLCRQVGVQDVALVAERKTS
jgi:biopolymer transport protein ExbD